MMGLDKVRKNKEIISVIDWDMTPEGAVTLYSEWGNSWTHGKSLIKSKDDVSYYFSVMPFLRCPISQREFEWDRFCYFVEEKNGVEWPHILKEEKNV